MLPNIKISFCITQKRKEERKTIEKLCAPLR